MSKQVVLDCVLVATVGLLFQLVWAWQTPLPTYMDGYYYTTNGAQIANGLGLSEEIIWQFLDSPAQLPVPSHSYWMPGPSFIAALGYLFADSFRAAQAPFWLLSGLLPIVTYSIAYAFALKRWQAISAALFTAAGGFYAGWQNQPATFAPFAWFGSACLLLMVLANRSQFKNRQLWVVAGILAGLAHLTRADGILFLATGLLYIGLLAWRDGSQHSVRLAIPFVGGYFLSMGGWFIRNWLVWQRPLATAGTQTIFLTTYDDLFAYGRTFDLSHLLEWGIGNIVSSRLDALSVAFQTFFAVNNLIFLFPFVVWGWVYLSRTQKMKLMPLTIYTLGLYATMSLVFTFPGQRGGLFHSSIAIWPWCMMLAPVGIERAVLTLAKRLPHWQPERASLIFTTLFVMVAFLMTSVLTLSRQAEDVETAVYQQFATSLPENAVVMVGNPPKFYYHTGHHALSVPNEPPEIVVQAASDYAVNYLILDSNVPIPLISIYQAERHYPEIERIQVVEGFQLYQFHDVTK